MKGFMLALTLMLSTIAIHAQVIFYGGDITVGDPNAAVFPTGETLAYPLTEVYTPIIFPSAGVMGYLRVNISSLNGYQDPDMLNYDIRVGVKEGEGGKSVLSGRKQLMTGVPTGRFPFGMQEDQYVLQLKVPLHYSPKVTYWISVSPVCTEQSQPMCQTQEFFLDNTTEETNGIHAQDQPSSEIYVNSAYYGYKWMNECDAEFGWQAAQCARASFEVDGSRY